MPNYLENPGFLEKSFATHNNKQQTVSKGEIINENEEQNIYRTIGDKNNKSGQYELYKIDGNKNIG